MKKSPRKKFKLTLECVRQQNVKSQINARDTVLIQCVQYLRKRGIESLFQVPSNMTIVKETLKKMVQGRKVFLLEEAVDDEHLVANILTYHLRELKEPVIPFIFYHRALQLGDVSDPADVQLGPLRIFLASLPYQNRTHLDELVSFLEYYVNMAQKKEEAKISTAEVFAPLLLKQRGSAFMSLRHMEGFSRSKNLLLALILYHSEAFKGLNTVKSPNNESPTREIRDLDLSTDTVVENLCRETVVSLLCQPIQQPNSQHSSSSFGLLASCSPEKCGLDNPALKNTQALFSDRVALLTGQLNSQTLRTLVRACRTLRCDVQRFEKRFVRDYGRRPKSRVDYGEMREAVEEYRAWKRSVREYAVSILQRWIRRCLARWKGKSFGGDAERDGESIAEIEAEEPSRDELLREKRKLKEKLKAFDQKFVQARGHAPGKADKEPIRHLYERYNMLKVMISSKERCESENALSEEKPSGLQIEFEGDCMEESDPAKNVASHATRSLLQEKRALQVKLKEFDRQFQAAHGRKVQFKSDLAPIAAEYEEYKSLKMQLAGVV